MERREAIIKLTIGISLLFIVIIAIIQLARIAGNITGSSDENIDNQQTELVLGEQNNLLSSVQFVIRGPIIAQEEHLEIRFTISQRTRLLQLINGYDGKVQKSISLPNTSNSYQALLDALEVNGFNEQKSTVGDGPEGICAANQVYFYRIKANGATVNELWAGSCSGGYGNFAGNNTAINYLFKSQFPSYGEFSAGTGL